MNQDFPLVTVLMPCKDPKVSFFREALNSVFSQTTPLWSLIIIDDHSRDKEIIGILGELGNPKVVKLSLLKNGSNLITGALNTGMRHAKTPYVCSLHCDDLLDENAIEVLNTYISEYPDIDYFHSSRVHINEDGYPIGSVKRVRESFSPSDFKNYDAPVKHLHCWKVKSALAIGGMDESLGLHGADDYDFPWCMAESGYSFKAIPECLYYYRDHREHYRLTTHVPLDTQINELKKIWEKHQLTKEEIEEQIKIRTSGYLKQALYSDEEDKRKKESENYDIRKGWREKYY
jgi:glycosyltransferase involved in cell wall biosynthesis